MLSELINTRPAFSIAVMKYITILPRTTKALLIQFILCSASPAYSSALTTECILHLAGRTKSLFPCSVSFDRKLNMGVIRDLRTGRVYGKEWAESRGCLYREGYGTVCTIEKRWVLPDGSVTQ